MSEGSVEATLEARGHKYGETFEALATVIQNIKRAMQHSPGWDKMTDDKKESLELIATKIGRIVVGDSNYHDSWHDIGGYAKLVADKILEDQNGRN